MKFWKGLTVGAIGAFGAAYAADCPAGQQMGPISFTDKGGMFCDKNTGDGTRGCIDELNCTSGQMKRSLADGNGGCGPAQCVDWPPACPSGETWRTSIFEDIGGHNCSPKIGYS